MTRYRALPSPATMYETYGKAGRSLTCVLCMHFETDMCLLAHTMTSGANPHASPASRVYWDPHNEACGAFEATE